MIVYIGGDEPSLATEADRVLQGKWYHCHAFSPLGAKGSSWGAPTMLWTMKCSNRLRRLTERLLLRFHHVVLKIAEGQISYTKDLFGGCVTKKTQNTIRIGENKYKESSKTDHMLWT